MNSLDATRRKQALAQPIACNYVGARTLQFHLSQVQHRRLQWHSGVHVLMHGRLKRCLVRGIASRKKRQTRIQQETPHILGRLWPLFGGPTVDQRKVVRFSNEDSNNEQRKRQQESARNVESLDDD